MKGKTPLLEERGALLRLLFLAAFFMLGIWLGRVAVIGMPSDTGGELRQYLQDFLRLDKPPLQGDAVWSAVLTYLRYPLLAFLLGFTAAGTVLLPCMAIVLGFSVSFSACCFAAAFGSVGVWLALAVLGVRCVVSLPCFFLLAVPAWSASGALASFSCGNAKRSGVCHRQNWMRLGMALLVLFAGLCVELFILPQLVLRPALEWALI